MFTSCIMPVLEVQRSFRVFLKRTVVGGGTGLSIIGMYHTVLASICLIVTDVVRALMTPSDEDEESIRNP